MFKVFLKITLKNNGVIFLDDSFVQDVRTTIIDDSTPQEFLTTSELSIDFSPKNQKKLSI